MRPNTVMNIRFVNDDTYRKAKCINHNVFLAPFDLLVPIDATVGGNMVRRLDTSGVYDPYTWRVIAPHRLADDDKEGVYEFFQHPFQLPLVEVVEDRVVGRKVLGKHSPLTACFHHIHDCIHDLPKWVFSLPMLRIQDNYSNLLLFISEVS